MEASNVGGFKSAAAVCKVLNNMEERHLVVIGGGVIQRGQPHVLQYGLEEEAGLLLDSADEALEVHLGGPFAFGFDAGGRISVGLDCRVVGSKRNFKAVESMAVRSAIGVKIVEEVGEADFASRYIDGMEEVGWTLVDALDVVVGQRACDGGEIGRGVGEEVLGLLSGPYDVGQVKKGGW